MMYISSVISKLSDGLGEGERGREGIWGEGERGRGSMGTGTSSPTPPPSGT